MTNDGNNLLLLRFEWMFESFAKSMFGVPDGI
jgi:hypothetical protein